VICMSRRLWSSRYMLGVMHCAAVHCCWWCSGAVMEPQQRCACMISWPESKAVWDAVLRHLQLGRAAACPMHGSLSHRDLTMHSDDGRERVCR
jgi:hypothetical protein